MTDVRRAGAKVARAGLKVLAIDFAELLVMPLVHCCVHARVGGGEGAGSLRVWESLMRVVVSRWRRRRMSVGVD